ncbi:MAG: tripartite tricarboxylate transporter substrate-binding protein, partial [Betaproteobacteria bacterium]|nr:tripartite tricarboxylate transporter substrate-binding protein [Betaproteobacteria bacterium]
MMRLTRKLFNQTSLLPLSLAVFTCAATLPAHAAWEPTRPVEVIVPAGAGGASDQMARTIQGIIVKHQLMKQPMLVMNKSGASGAEGIMDVKGSKGDPHKLMVAFSAIDTLPIAVNLPFNWRDLNPVAMIAMDEFLLWVNSETSYKTPKE